MFNQELATLSRLWSDLAGALVEEVGSSSSASQMGGSCWRHILANHLSECCQPLHAGSVVDSLEGRFTFTASASGGVDCLLTLATLFVQVASPPGPFRLCVGGHTKEYAEEAVCLQTLLFCCIVGPNLVRLHPTMVRDVDRIRMLANLVRVEAWREAPSVSGSLPWIEACWDVQNSPHGLSAMVLSLIHI